MQTFVSRPVVRELEGVADDPVHALPGVHLFLNRNLVVGVPALNRPPMLTYSPSVFSRNTDEVHVLRRAPLERAQPLVQQLHGPVVDVEIQLEARAQQNVAGVPVIGDTRVTQRADEHSVEVVTQHRVAVGRQGDAGREKVIRAPRQRLELEGPAKDLPDACKHAYRFGGDLFVRSRRRE